MATTDVVLTMAQPYPGVIGAPTMGGSGGSWSTGAKSFMVISQYNSAISDTLDSWGFALGVPGAWQNFTVGVGDTAKQLTLTWTAASHIPDYYLVLEQLASSYTLTNPGRIAATVAGTLTTATIVNEPGASPVVTLAAAYSTMTLCPVNLTPRARDSVVSGINSQTSRRSYCNNILYDQLSLQLFGTSATAANYKLLQKWAHRDYLLKLDDMDTATYVDYWTGRLKAPTSLNSDSKQGGYPALTFDVETEVYN